MTYGRLSMTIVRFDGAADIELKGLEFPSAIPSPGDTFRWDDSDGNYSLYEFVKSREWFGGDFVQLNCRPDIDLDRNDDYEPVWGMRPESLNEQLEYRLSDGWTLRQRRTVWNECTGGWVCPSTYEAGNWLPALEETA